MHKTSEIQKQLSRQAEEISRQNGGAPVIIIVAGSKAAGVPECVTAWANLGEGREGRLRDLIGILQTAIQIESIKHFGLKR